jgi:hypothetical protein
MSIILELIGCTLLLCDCLLAENQIKHVLPCVKLINI